MRCWCGVEACWCWTQCAKYRSRSWLLSLSNTLPHRTLEVTCGTFSLATPTHPYSWSMGRVGHNSNRLTITTAIEANKVIYLTWWKLVHFNIPLAWWQIQNTNSQLNEIGRYFKSQLKLPMVESSTYTKIRTRTW